MVMEKLQLRLFKKKKNELQFFLYLRVVKLEQSFNLSRNFVSPVKRDEVYAVF